MIDIQKDQLTPLYEQVYADMFNKITSRHWKPGQCIPAEMELCEVYGVSRVTIRKAIEDLVRSGHLTRRRGKGTFVHLKPIENKLSKFYSFSESLKSKGHDEVAEVLAFDTMIADEILIDKLKLKGHNVLVFKITRLRSVDDVPYAVETSYIPKAIVPDLTEAFVATNGLYNAMQQLNVVPNKATETFRAISLGGLEARLLQQDLQVPVMSIERVTFCGDIHVEYCCSTVRGDFFSYTVELGY